MTKSKLTAGAPGWKGSRAISFADEQQPRHLLLRQPHREQPIPDNLDKAELAAWTHIARVLLNLHESITRS